MSRYFAWAALAKYHLVGGLTNRTVVSHGSGGFRSENKVCTALYVLRPLSPWLPNGCHLLISSSCLHMIVLLCVYVS